MTKAQLIEKIMKDSPYDKHIKKEAFDLKVRKKRLFCAVLRKPYSVILELIQEIEKGQTRND